MAKNFIYSVLIFIFFFVPVASASAQTTAEVQDCSVPGLEYCEQAIFMDTMEKDMTLVVVQESLIPASPSEIASMLFVDVYLGGLNAEVNIFEVDQEITEDMEDDFLTNADAFIVLEGTSDLIERGQDATMVVVANDGLTYVFISIGESDNFLTFIENTIEDGAIKNIPENYLPIPLDSSI